MILKGMISITLSENCSEKHLPVGVFPYDISLMIPNHLQLKNKTFNMYILLCSTPPFYTVFFHVETSYKILIHIVKTSGKSFIRAQPPSPTMYNAFKVSYSIVFGLNFAFLPNLPFLFIFPIFRQSCA